MQWLETTHCLGLRMFKYIQLPIYLPTVMISWWSNSIEQHCEIVISIPMQIIINTGA